MNKSKNSASDLHLLPCTAISSLSVVRLTHPAGFPAFERSDSLLSAMILNCDLCSPDSAWKSGPVRFFVHIQKDRDRNWSTLPRILRKTGPNRRRPVHSGFYGFLRLRDRSKPVMVSTG